MWQNKKCETRFGFGASPKGLFQKRMAALPDAASDLYANARN